MAILMFLALAALAAPSAAFAAPGKHSSDDEIGLSDAVVVGGSASIGTSPTLAKKTGGTAASSSACPSSTSNFKEANNVGADFTNEGLTTTYTFISFKDEDPVGGVPGLIKYCVYTDSSDAPTAIKTDAIGDNGQKWISRTKKKSGSFSFGRPGGNESNIPLDGTETKMGTATWAKLPSSQTIVLHINDPAVCAALYPATGYEELPPDTCFVLPGEPPTAICDAGSDEFAYNALPFDFGVGCPPPPSLAFEAQQTNEFGDGVGLAGTGTTITSLTVDFQSYGCSDEGHWNKGQTDPCVTTAGETFTIPASGPDPAGITAHLYKVVPGSPDTVGEEIEMATNDAPIPFRPSANAEKCPGPAPEAENGSQWYDPVSELCLSSLSVPITFNFPAGTEVPPGGEVIWTVTFNTTTEGYNPIGVTACNTEPLGNPAGTPPGCGHDSLNVGVKTYEGAPYAGTDLEPDVAYRSFLGNGDLLLPETGWAGFTPLAQITTGP